MEQQAVAEARRNETTSGGVSFWKRPRTHLLAALWAVLGLALWLRASGVGFGLPYLHHPDEPNKVRIALEMIQTGDLNPRYFKKPTLLIYVNALAQLPYLAWAKATGQVESIDEIRGPWRLVIGVGYVDHPALMLIGRYLSVGIGVLCVWLVFQLGRRYLRADLPALFAALVYAVSYEAVAQSHYVETNVYLVAALLGTSWAALSLYERGTSRHYLLTGFLVGLAATAKYPGIVGGIMLVVAHLARSRFLPVVDRKLLYGLAAIPAGFLLGTPYALLSPKAFLNDTLFEVDHYKTGHDGFEGNTPAFYLDYAWTFEGPLLFVGLLAIARALVQRNVRLILLASFPLVYLPFILSFHVRFGRTFMPVVPFAILLGAGLLFELREALRNEARSRWLRIAGSVGVALVAFWSVQVPLTQSLAFDRKLNGPDSREPARRWLEANVPKGSKVAIEAYGPWLSPSEYRLKGFNRIADKRPDFYVKQGFEYLVFSEEMFARYFEDEARYREKANTYRSLWKRFPRIATFKDGEFEIRVHRVRR